MTENSNNLSRRGKYAIRISLLLTLCGLAQGLHASECDEPVARALSVQGRVEVISNGDSTWSLVQQNMGFCPGDRLRVSANSRAGLMLDNETLLRLAENSSVRINAPEKEGSAWLDLLEGIAHFISRVTHPFQVNTPYVNASIEGTEFTVEAGPERARITVLEGRVHARNEQGEVVVNGGQRADSLKDQAPRAEAVVDPLNAVQWALYYPPVAEPPKSHPSEAVTQSLEAYRRGDLSGAFTALADEPAVAEQATLLVYRASLHLQVGSTDAAQEDLEAALRLEPEQGDALALMSIIATVNNEGSQAMELARQAVEVSGDWTCACGVGTNLHAAAAQLALSYAEQARFQLPEALKAARHATQVAPESPLAWSRLAQLELMFHNLDASNEAARRAVEIAPEQPQSQTTLGFTRLIRLDLDGARQAFEQAIALDQADPLPRLGLGLVQIRQGDLEDGRRQLETAANLDPGNALIRSYLGKAYYEEKRNQRAATQFALAKQFDDLDPTAWFYDAILKQSENRPIEALKEIATSIELNDNRAVYRSRLLLDQDEAARGTSLARIYQELGFDRQARNEAYKSLQSSPQNHSAHRLLSDSYFGEPRYETVRLSELLLSQLLQPLNTSPIQPQLAASRLGILDGAGPSASGFSEYTPLFTRNGLDFQLNAIKGSNASVGDDLILSGLKDRISFSLSQFHYKTDGWRENNDLRQDIQNAFLQAALSSSTSVQFEYRHQKAKYGDLAFAFEPDYFNPYERNELERSIGRIGLQHQFSPNSRLLASAIYQDMQQSNQWEVSSQAPFGTVVESDITASDSISRTLELQTIHRLFDHTFTFGGGNYDEDYTEDWQHLITITPPLPMPLPQTPPTHDLINPQFKNVYLYSVLTLPSRLSMTLGVTYEDFKNYVIEADQVNPKFGLTWDASKNLSFRIAYLESLARPEHLEQSIEQTQVAGFNQRFDDVGASEIKHTGFGMDAKLGNDLTAGAEFNRRSLRVPATLAGGAGVVYEDRDEKRSNAYLYWTATQRLAMRISFEKEELERPAPLEVLTTQRTPVGFSYHWPWGLFLTAEGTYINQEITRSGVTDRDSFWNLDGVLGYRFPKRYGKVELIVKNMLDEEFNYYDLSFHTGEPLMPQFQPGRQIFARFTLNF